MSTQLKRIVGAVLSGLCFHLNGAAMDMNVNGWEITLGSDPNGQPFITGIRRGGVNLLSEGKHPFPKLFVLKNFERVPVNGVWTHAEVTDYAIDLQHSSGAKGRMEFATESRILGRKPWQVLKYRFQIESPEPLAALEDQFTYALDGGGDGLEVAMQRFVGGQDVMYFGWKSAGLGDEVQTIQQPLYACAQPWDTQFKDGLMLIKWPGVTDTSIWNRYNKEAGSAGVQYHDTWVYGRSRSIQTSWMHVALANNTGKNDWINAVRDLNLEVNRAYGLLPEEPLPWGYSHAKNYIRDERGRERAQTLTSWIERHLDPFKDMGLSRLGMISLWESNATHEIGSMLAIHSLEIPEAMGGREAVAPFMSAIADEGMRFIAWAPLSLSHESRLWQEYPHWRVLKADGTPFTFAFKDIAGAHLGRGFGAYLLDGLVDLRQQDGLGGIWWDSYPTFGPEEDYSMDEPRGMLPELLQTTAMLRQGGLELLLEGVGPLGLPAVTIKTDAVENWPEGFERALFDTAHVFYYVDRGFQVWNPPFEHYLRFLANRSTPAVDYSLVNEEDRPAYRAANLAYVEALPFMDYSLPDPQPGLRAWQSHDDQTTILFHLGGETVSWPATGVARLFNLTTQQPVEASGEKFHLHPQQVYRLQHP